MQSAIPVVQALSRGTVLPGCGPRAVPDRRAEVRAAIAWSSELHRRRAWRSPAPGTVGTRR